MGLKQFMQIVWKRLWIIIAVVILCTTAAGLYSVYYMNPLYEASSKIIVNKSNLDSSGNPSLDVNGINTNIMLINSYKEIISSKAIMNKVLEQNPDIQLSAIDLIERLSVIPVQNSQIVTLKVVDSSYNRAVEIVNAISKVFKEEVPSIMKVDNITILDSAVRSDHAAPISPNVKLNVAIALVISLMLSVGIVFLLDVLDDSIKSEQDVEQLLELNTLGVITSIRKQDMKRKNKSKINKQAGDNYAAASH